MPMQNGFQLATPRSPRTSWRLIVGKLCQLKQMSPAILTVSLCHTVYVGHIDLATLISDVLTRNRLLFSTGGHINV